MLQENVKGFRREIEAMRERNLKMTATHQRHEEIIHTITQDLREANEKLAMAEVGASSYFFLYDRESCGQDIGAAQFCHTDSRQPQ